MVRYHNVNGERIQFTAEEETQRDAEEKAWNDASADRKLSLIREIRNQKLFETDYLAMSDNTMSDEMKTFRKSMRDVPQDYDSSKYDELLNRDINGKLTHSVWSKP
tara:strand:- start:44 stop:361 length:318 start_codon:yes stop_codon:yes gene_type:complete